MNGDQRLIRIFRACSTPRAAAWLAGFSLLIATVADAAPVVPGTGRRLAQGGDDFEDPKWKFTLNLPKSSEEQDKNIRMPGGVSSNNRWQESAKRGTPDLIKRVPPPEGGIAGSQGAMLMRTLNSMVPGAISNTIGQDDLLFNPRSEFGGSIPVSATPSVVTRVYLPPFEDWEQRTGNSFGFRAGVRTTKTTPGRFLRPGKTEIEPYWPGIFICYWPKGTDARYKDGPSATLVIRGNHMGHELQSTRITEPGWWTLGMSFTPDGMVHYYAHAGVEKLTPKDLIVSYYPYGYHCEYFGTFFYDLMNKDDGKSWSTPWVVDDTWIYVVQ